MALTDAIRRLRWLTDRALSKVDEAEADRMAGESLADRLASMLYVEGAGRDEADEAAREALWVLACDAARDRRGGRSE